MFIESNRATYGCLIVTILHFAVCSLLGLGLATITGDSGWLKALYGYAVMPSVIIGCAYHLALGTRFRARMPVVAPLLVVLAAYALWAAALTHEQGHPGALSVIIPVAIVIAWDLYRRMRKLPYPTPEEAREEKRQAVTSHADASISLMVAYFFGFCALAVVCFANSLEMRSARNDRWVGFVQLSVFLLVFGIGCLIWSRRSRPTRYELGLLGDEDDEDEEKRRRRVWQRAFSKGCAACCVIFPFVSALSFGCTYVDRYRNLGIWGGCSLLFLLLTPLCFLGYRKYKPPDESTRA